MRSYIATLDPHKTKDREYFCTLTFTAQALCGLDTYPVYNKSNFDRYYVGESLDNGKYYVISDDDVIPFELNMFNKSLEIMEKYPNIGVLGFTTKPHLQKEDVQAYVISEIEDRLWEFDHFGGIRVVRRGFIEKPNERPDYANGRGGDRIFCDMVRRKGFICALAADLWFHHLGETKSTVWS